MPTPYDDCLNEAVLHDLIDEKQRDQFQKAFNDAKLEAERMGKSVGEQTNWASAQAVKQMMNEVGKKKVDVAQKIMKIDAAIESVKKTQVQKMPEWIAKIVGETNAIYRGVETLLGERIRGWGSDLSITQQREAARGVLFSHINSLMEAIRTKNLGLTRDRVAPKEMMRAYLDGHSDVAGAKENAGGYLKAKELALNMLEEQGVKVNRIEKHAPQDFNSGKLHDMGKEAFVESMMSDWKAGTFKLRDWSSPEGAYFQPGKDDARVLEMLGGTDKKPGMYKTITTNGNAAIQPGVRRGETMTDRYNKRRVIDWKDADAYFHFLDKYGHGSENLGEILIREMNGFADDIGTVRVLGDDAQRTVDTILDWAKREGNLSSGQIKALEKTWFHSSGEANQVANVTMANAAKTTRLWLTSVQLPNAMLGAAPDFAFAKSISTFNGLNTSRMISDYLRSGVDVRKARQQGLIVQADRGFLHDHAGEQFTLSGPAKYAGMAAEFVMKGTGLDGHTTRLRTMVGREFLATMADIADKGWADLPALNRRFLERYGIDGKDWELLRTHAMSGERLFMDPALMAREQTGRARDAAMKMLGAVDAESGIAINESSTATRAMWLGKTHPGDFGGELLRSFQYKGFATSVMLKSGWRMVDSMFDSSGMTPRGRYIAGLVIEATVLGAFSLQLKNIATGKDPESMDTVSFWGKAAAQGGAGGMLGDYVKTMWQTRSLSDTSRMLTPTAGLMADAYALTTGNLGQMYEGEKTNAGREAARFAKKYAMPRLWMTNLAVDRMVWDTLQRVADPDAAGSFQRQRQKLHKDTGQSYFSAPGSDFSDMRAPDAGAAFRARQ